MILCIPATSAPSERLFSEAGQVVKHSRTLLNSDRVEQLVFIHENYFRVQPHILRWKLDPKEFDKVENSSAKKSSLEVEMESNSTVQDEPESESEDAGGCLSALA